METILRPELIPSPDKLLGHLGEMVSLGNCIPGLAYGRTSTAEQTRDEKGFRKDDSTLEVQHERACQYIKYQNEITGKNYVLAAFLSDEGVSGKDTNRPAYRRMWMLIASGRIKFILAAELSRLSRNVRDFLELVAHCEKHGVAIFILGLNLDTSTPQGRVMIVILVALAQFEREQTSQRNRENALSRLLTDGKINGSAEILGLLRDTNPGRKGHFIVSPEGIRTAETIMKLFIKLSSKRKVYLMAKELGLTGPKGKELTLRQIEIALGNSQTRYRGIWYVNKNNRDKNQKSLPPSQRFQEVKLPHGPLIDEKLLDAVAEKMNDSRRSHKKSGSDEWIYLLSHVLFHEDGTNFQGQCAKNRKYRYYHNRAHGLRIRCEELDKKVVGRLKDYLRNDERFAALVKDALRRKEAALLEVEKEIRKAESEAESLKAEDVEIYDSYKRLLEKEKANAADGNVSSWLSDRVADLRKKRERKETELELLYRQRTELMERSGLNCLHNSIEEFISTFEKFTGTQRRNLLEKIVKRVVIKSGNQIELQLYQDPSIGPRVDPDRLRQKIKTPEPLSSAASAVAVVAQEKSTGGSKNGVLVGTAHLSHSYHGRQP